MRIREIANQNMSEGVLDTLKAATTWGSGETWGQAKSRVQTNTAMQNLLKKAVPAWNSYAKNLKSMTPDPARYQQLYQQSLAAFVQKNLMGNQPIDSAINRREITQLIADITAAEDNPQQVASLFGQLTKQAAMSQQDTNRNDVAKIISTQPAVIEFRNVVYAQNDEGKWANQKTGRILDEPTQNFLDQELARAGG
jgi:cell fate (sporulation/competence/biofilm development) regulator YmcA (YheA/YmcA/DUF963 family)